MTTQNDDKANAPMRLERSARGADARCTVGTPANIPGAQSPLSPPVDVRRQVARGITSRMGSWPLQRAIWERSLALVNRFRVIRTIDIAVHCFAERPFKAALSAAQRAVRGMVKQGLLSRYRTDRFMTVYGLTQAGAEWLDDRGTDAAASVRRVTDMTNPEHRLWAQFLTLCAQARGGEAMTESELLQRLNEKIEAGNPVVQGLLQVTVNSSGKRRSIVLRPDAVSIELDGITWFEVDRSARGSNRAAALRVLVLSVGAKTTLGPPLRRVVIHTRTDRIKKRVVATLTNLAHNTVNYSLAEGRRQLKLVEGQHFEVWLTVNERLDDGRVRLVDVLAGHVLVQELPVWLPRVRLDGRDGYSPRGWFDENQLPYPRPECMPA